MGWTSDAHTYEEFLWRVKGRQYVVIERRRNHGIQAALVESALDEYERLLVAARNQSWSAEVWRERPGGTHLRPVRVLSNPQQTSIKPPSSNGGGVAPAKAERLHSPVGQSQKAGIAASFVNASAEHRPPLFIATAKGPTDQFDEGKHPRWPKGTPLGGKFMSLDGEGFPMSPQVGSATNQEHQVQADGMYAAAKAGDWSTVGKLAAKPMDKFTALGGKTTSGWLGTPNAQVAWPTKETKGGSITTQDKWSMQKLQYAQALIDAKGKVTQLGAKVDAITGPPDLSSYKKIGSPFD